MEQGADRIHWADALFFVGLDQVDQISIGIKSKCYSVLVVGLIVVPLLDCGTGESFSFLFRCNHLPKWVIINQGVTGVVSDAPRIDFQSLGTPSTMGGVFSLKRYRFTSITASRMMNIATSTYSIRKPPFREPSAGHLPLA